MKTRDEGSRGPWTQNASPVLQPRIPANNTSATEAGRWPFSRKKKSASHKWNSLRNHLLLVPSEYTSWPPGHCRTAQVIPVLGPDPTHSKAWSFCCWWWWCFILFIGVCVHKLACVMWQHLCGGHRTTLWSWFSLSMFMWVPRTEPRSLGLHSKPLSLLSPLISP